MATNQGFISLVPDTKVVSPEFLAHWIRWNKQVFVDRASGSTFLELSRGSFKQIPILLPPIDHQKSVADTLNACAGALLARRREAAIEGERKRSLIEHLLSRGTGSEERVVTEIGDLPASWGVGKLRDVCSFASGGTPSKANTSFWEGSIPWVSGKDLKAARLRDVRDHITPEGAAAGSKIAPSHSILLLVRGMGLVKDIPMSQITRPMAFNQDLKAISAPDEKTSDYLYWALQHRKSEFERHIGMAAHGTRKISGSVLENFLVPMPPQKEREQIAQVLWAHHAWVEALEEEANLLEELYRVLLEELMTGRLPHKRESLSARRDLFKDSN